MAVRRRPGRAPGPRHQPRRDRGRDARRRATHRSALDGDGRSCLRRRLGVSGRPRRGRRGRSGRRGLRMTATVALARTVLDLDASATIMDAARRLDAADRETDVVLVVPAGAPLARNVVFLEVLRRRAAGRRLFLVSSDARARSLAASVHIPAFAGLAALDRRELDPTERLTEARRVALATIAAEGGERPRMSFRRSLAVMV